MIWAAIIAAVLARPVLAIGITIHQHYRAAAMKREWQRRKRHG